MCDFLGEYGYCTRYGAPCSRNLQLMSGCTGQSSVQRKHKHYGYYVNAEAC